MIVLGHEIETLDDAVYMRGVAESTIPQLINFIQLLREDKKCIVSLIEQNDDIPLIQQSDLGVTFMSSTEEVKNSS